MWRPNGSDGGVASAAALWNDEAVAIVPIRSHTSYHSCAGWNPTMFDGAERLPPISVTTWPDEDTRTPNRGCTYLAETTVAEVTHTVRSRHGAGNELARALVATGITDRPMEIRDRRRSDIVQLRYPSFRAAARWTYTEGNRTLARVPLGRPANRLRRCQGSPKTGGKATADIFASDALLPLSRTIVARRARITSESGHKDPVASSSKTAAMPT
jgi:hypothetical protein